jgi:hypothetical protein
MAEDKFLFLKTDLFTLLQATPCEVYLSFSDCGIGVGVGIPFGLFSLSSHDVGIPCRANHHHKGDLGENIGGKSNSTLLLVTHPVPAMPTCAHGPIR